MEKRMSILLESDKNREAGQIKWPVRFIYDLSRHIPYAAYGQLTFEQFLIDSEGRYWFSEKAVDGKETTQIFIFDAKGAILKKLVVQGKPVLYEFERWVIIACEGIEASSHIYKFSKQTLSLEDQWTVDGFLWDLDGAGEALFITSYLTDINEAVLYIVDGNRKKALDLGTGLFPTGIICCGKALYISFSDIQTGCKGKLIKLDWEGHLLEESPLDIAPRQMFLYDGHIILHGLDMAKGSANQLVYYNVQTGERQVYKIPKASDLRPHGKHILLHNREKQSIIYWSHEKRKIIRVLHMPAMKKEFDAMTYRSL